MTLQTEILLTETSDFLKRIIFLKSFYSVFIRKAKICFASGEWLQCQEKQLSHFHFFLPSQWQPTLKRKNFSTRSKCFFQSSLPFFQTKFVVQPGKQTGNRVSLFRKIRCIHSPSVVSLTELSQSKVGQKAHAGLILIEMIKYFLAVILLIIRDSLFIRSRLSDVCLLCEFL